MGTRGDRGASSVQEQRLRRACVAVALVLAAVAAVLATPAAGRGAADVDGAATAGRIWDSMASGKAFEDAIEEVGLVKVCRDNTPGWFEEEVFDAGFVEGAIANSGFDVVYMSKQGSEEDVACTMEAMLARKGWQQAASEAPPQDDGGNIMTFFKRKGGCRWAMIECAQAGEEVSVVLHTRHT